MKITALILGVLIVAFGLMWLLQGLNVLTGSAMSGQNTWVVIGGSVTVVGIVMTVLAARIKKK